MSDKYRKRGSWNLNRILISVTLLSILLNGFYFVRLSNCEAQRDLEASKVCCITCRIA